MFSNKEYLQELIKEKNIDIKELVTDYINYGLLNEKKGKLWKKYKLLPETIEQIIHNAIPQEKDGKLIYPLEGTNEIYKFDLLEKKIIKLEHLKGKGINEDKIENLKEINIQLIGNEQEQIKLLKTIIKRLDNLEESEYNGIMSKNIKLDSFIEINKDIDLKKIEELKINNKTFYIGNKKIVFNNKPQLEKHKKELLKLEKELTELDQIIQNLDKNNIKKAIIKIQNILQKQAEIIEYINQNQEKEINLQF